MKTLFDSVRTSNPNGTIILDGGDLIQGGAIAALSEGSALPNIINAMGYDFLIPGNWEVVYGKKTMIDVLGAYDAPVISANIYDSETGVSISPPYLVQEVHGIKIRFISYDDPDIPVRQSPKFSEGLRFDPIEKNLSALINKLKFEEQVDKLFLVTHLGISKQVHLANDSTLKLVDYILGNDTHERIRKPLEQKYAKVTEPGAFGSFVGKLGFIVKDGKIITENYELMENHQKIYKKNKKFQAIIDKESLPYRDEVDEILGYTKTPLYRYFIIENPMDNFITDAARWKTGVDISLSNGFRFSPPLNTP